MLVPFQRGAHYLRDSNLYVGDHAFEHKPNKSRKDWQCIEVRDDEICVGLLKEERDLNSDVSPIMICPSRFKIDTCQTWYQTGNPYKMQQMSAHVIKCSGKLGNVQLRNISLVDEMISELGIVARIWPEYEKDMLPDIFMPQQRWVVTSAKLLIQALDKYQMSQRICFVGPRVPDPPSSLGPTVYLIEAIGTKWVKFGKAAEGSALIRLRQSQLCSPYRLRQLGVWPAPDGNAGYWERRLESALKAAGSDKRWEWVEIDAMKALCIAKDIFER